MGCARTAPKSVDRCLGTRGRARRRRRVRLERGIPRLRLEQGSKGVYFQPGCAEPGGGLRQVSTGRRPGVVVRSTGVGPVVERRGVVHWRGDARKRSEEASGREGAEPPPVVDMRGEPFTRRASEGDSATPSDARISSGPGGRSKIRARQSERKKRGASRSSRHHPG